MKRFTWWRMEQNAPHNAQESWCASCSILHHNFRTMSHTPHIRLFVLTFTGLVIRNLPQPSLLLKISISFFHSVLIEFNNQ